MVPKCSEFVQKLLNGQTPCICEQLVTSISERGKHLQKDHCSQADDLFQTLYDS